LLEGTDACVTPVLSLDEAPNHPHIVARGTFVRGVAYARPNAAPRFRDANGIPAQLARADESEAILARCGFAPAEIRSLRDAGTLG
jgi:alpha-methylacyl-CoA racemase